MAENRFSPLSFGDWIEKECENAMMITRIGINTFRGIYQRYPKYIKVPEGFIAKMEAWNDMHFVKTEKPEDYIAKFMGLTVCETPKITSVFQIEVF